MADSTADEEGETSDPSEGEVAETHSVRVRGTVTSIAPDTQVGRYQIKAELKLNLEFWPVSGVDFDRHTKMIVVVGTTTKAVASRMRIGDPVTFRAVP